MDVEVDMDIAELHFQRVINAAVTGCLRTGGLLPAEEHSRKQICLNFFTTLL